MLPGESKLCFFRDAAVTASSTIEHLYDITVLKQSLESGYHFMDLIAYYIVILSITRSYAQYFFID
jgi:hypothetical protein